MQEQQGATGEPAKPQGEQLFGESEEARNTGQGTNVSAQAQPGREPSNPADPSGTFADVLRDTPPLEGVSQRTRPRRVSGYAERWQAMLHNPRAAILTGIVASNGLALVVMLLTSLILSLSGSDTGLFVASEFVLLPMLMGGVCAYFWQEAKLSRAAHLAYGTLNSIVALLLAFVFLREGVVCLLMASPLLIVFNMLGGWIGRKIFKARRSRLNATLVPLALTLFLGDSLAPHHFANCESDRIVIHASPARVWQYIVDYPANHAPSDYWLSSLGLPAPVQSTTTGHVVGATRRCIFTGGITFDEKITVVKPERELDFDVTTQPNHPEVIGHLTLEKGQFLLTDNHDGTTTVTGTSWYKLNVYPVSYYDLWTQDVIRHVHLRVMRHIKMLAEKQADEKQVN